MNRPAILIAFALALALGIIATGSVLAIGEDQQSSSFVIKPALSQKNFSTSGDDACVTDSYFGAIFYNEPDWTNASSALFRKNIAEPWGDIQPAPGIYADDDWSAKYEADFSIISLNPPNPPPLSVDAMVYANFTGTLRVYIDDVMVFNQVNPGEPKLFYPNDKATLNSSEDHFIQVWYSTDATSNPTLTLYGQWCDATDPNICSKFDLFFTGAGTGPSR